MVDKIKKLSRDYLTIKLQQGVSGIITANAFYIMNDIKEINILALGTRRPPMTAAIRNMKIMKPLLGNPSTSFTKTKDQVNKKATYIAGETGQGLINM